MPSPNHYTKRPSPSPSPTQPRPKPTGGGYFYKSILFALFLLALPLFPSQAPDFIGETILTKFWELIHLLFVGIAVAYGLFSRRNVESANDLRVNRVDESSLSYVSRIFPVSSVFDDDLEESKDRELESESFELDEISRVEAWNSRYFQGRSKVVVVGRPVYGNESSHVVYQPLGLPVRSLRDNVAAAPVDDDVENSSDGIVNEEKAESLVDESIEAAAASSSPVQWQSRPEMMGMGESYPKDYQFGSVKSRSSSRSSVSSSSSETSNVSRTQKRFSPSRSVSQESLNSNVEEEKSLKGSSRSNSPSLPPSPPSLPPSLPPSPELVTIDTHRSVSHSRHYSDGSLLEEVELDGNKVRERRTEFFGKSQRGSKSLNLTGESSRKWKNKSRSSYPPDVDDSTTIRRDLKQKSDEDNIGKVSESDYNKRRVKKKGSSNDSLELTGEEETTKDEKFTESFPALDVLFQPTNAKASRGAIRSTRGGHESLPEKDIITRRDDSVDYKSSRVKDLSEPNSNSPKSFPALDALSQPTNAKASRRAMRSTRGGHESLPEKDMTRRDDSVDYNKSIVKDLPGSNKEPISNSPRSQPQSWRATSMRGKSVRTIRNGKDLKTDADSSDDQTEEAKERTKPRKQWHQELSIVLHQEKPEELEEEEDDVTEENKAEQPQATLEEEEEAGWESQSNASHDHNEVDRKAGEFIAKFREQIRLQKLTSGEQPRGGGGGRGDTNFMRRNNHFR